MNRIRFIEERYTDIYLSIMGLIGFLIALIYSMGYSVIGGIIVLLLYIGYISLVIKNFIEIKEIRAVNDNIIKNGKPISCSIEKVYKLMYSHTDFPVTGDSVFYTYQDYQNMGKRKAIQLVLKYEYDNEIKRLTYDGVLYPRDIKHIECKEFYVLDEKIYPLVYKVDKNNIDWIQETNRVIEETASKRLLRGANIIINLMAFVFLIGLFTALFFI